jgi:acetolactate synthase-1/2/3 large subunit
MVEIQPEIETQQRADGLTQPVSGTPLSEPMAQPLAAARSGAELLVRAMCEQGVATIYGYPGGAIMPVYDALTRYPVRHVLTRHEQGAAFAANAHGRVTGEPGVCLATSGPGATNLITGIADAAMDSVPMIAITGQVATPLMGTDAFQEVDIYGMTYPIVKHSFLVRDVADLPRVVAEAFRIAREGRPGPVLIDLPKDVQIAPAPSTPYRPDPPAEPEALDPLQLARAERWIRESSKPLLYAGGGIAISGAIDAFRGFARRSGIPCVTTLKALGALPPEDPANLGMLGMHGTRNANMAVQEADLLICVGARFDDRATGKLDGFAPNARVIHMDIDAAEIGKLRRADVPLRGDLVTTLGEIHAAPEDMAAWWKRCQSLKVEHAQRYDAPGEDVYAPALLNQLSRARDNLLICSDVGQHQMWVAQHCAIRHPRALLSSSSLGAMGFGLPAAIGAKLARPGDTVVVVTGDGSIMMNIQEFSTLRRYGIDVKIVLLDNSALGMVRQWQELFFEENYSEVDLSDNPDFAAVARAFGVDAFTLTRRADVAAAIEQLLDHPGPCLMHVPIDPRANVWPLVPPGKTNDCMMEKTP